MNNKELADLSKSIRRDVLEMISLAGSGHPGSSLSAVDIIVSLYFTLMRHRPDDPKWPERDRFVLSKGHAAPALYAVLARAGYFDRDQLFTLRKLGSILQGHPDANKCPGIDASTGPLGQGLSFANGIAMAAKADRKDYKVYVMLGDGELQEGQVWEAAMTAGHHNLNNVVAIVDCNILQIDGRVSDIKRLHPLADKWRSFDWNVISINGHNHEMIVTALSQINDYDPDNDPLNMYFTWATKPNVVLAHTVKGKGIKRMEHKREWHGKRIEKDVLLECLKELE
jgi:transketolase